MKKKKLLLIIFICGNSLFALSNVNETEKLATAAKIWGFLKYYHPEVGKGNFNWDNQLIQILPKVMEARDKQELSNVYLEWIDTLGKVEICEKCTSKESKNYFGKNFDLIWTRDTLLFSKALIEKLALIEKNRFQGNHHYVSYLKAVGNVNIKNEPEYPDFNWENESLRLLSLFRYWNYIEYFYPYKYQIDKNWDMVLEESIQTFLSPTSEIDYHLAMLQLIVNINDSHGYLSTNLLNNYFGSYSIPALLEIIDNKAIITRFLNEKSSKESGWQIGDIILEINDVKIETILAKNAKYIHGSNASVKLKNGSGKLYSGSNNSINIKFEREGKIETKNIQNKPFNLSTYEKPIADKWRIINGSIGYVNMGEIERIDVKMIMDSLLNTESIIFDIRNYPKGTMYAVSNYLNKSPQEFVKFISPDIQYPGKFNWKETVSCGQKNAKAYTGKVIILVNEFTQSHAEFTTMCLQTAENAIVIGSQTSGADGNVSTVELVGGFKTGFTGVGIFYPNGKETQRIGIIPDIKVKRTINGIKDGKDEVLDRAIQVASE